MRSILIPFALCAAVSACATYDGPHGGGYLAYDGFYDDHYGQIYGGYWDNDVFYYRNTRGGDFRRDDEHHFRRDGGEGYHPMHVRGPAPGGGGRPGGDRGDHGHH